MGMMRVAVVVIFAASDVHSFGLGRADLVRRQFNMLRRRHRDEEESQAQHCGDDHAETGEDASQHH